MSGATRAWIAAHPGIAVAYTPKHASWLDMAEMWFSVLTRSLLRRGEFTSRAELADKITTFAIRYNRTAHPGKWRYEPAPITPDTTPATANPTKPTSNYPAA